MSQRKVDWPFGKSWFRKSTPRRTFRTRLGPPLAAQIEFLEDRTLLSTSLGTAGNFAVLAGSTVTNTGPSAIDGDVGVSPGSAVVPGSPPWVVTNGTIHAADAVALLAQSDLTTAYNHVAGLPVPLGHDLTSLTLGTTVLTLTPGVYHFSSSAQLTGTLTLDAQGDPNAEFDFQIGSTLTTASNSSVEVINGGNPCNVFWQVGSSATLGTGTAFEGHILALASITVTTGASVRGSTLAQVGAVTLDTNSISIADCTPGGEFQLITISGTKFQDTNGNGIRNAGEPGLPGFTIFLDSNNNGILDTGERSTISDANGNFSFSNVGPGTYRVREVQQTGFTQTTVNPFNILPLSGVNVAGVDFGNFQLITISGTKFQDTNGTGVRDAGEPGLPGFTIFFDSNHNGVLDTGERSTISDANGNFSFSNLALGTYRVREVGQTNFVQMTNNPADIVVTTSGANVTGTLFGNIPVANLVTVSKLLLTGQNLSNLLNGTLGRQANFVANLFEASLGRAPNLKELTDNLRLLMAGFNEQQVTAMFGSSTGNTVTDFVNVGNGLVAQLVSNGSNTQVFINELGDVVQGNWIDPTQSSVAAWGNDVATFSPGRINWSDGSVWKQVSNTPLAATVTDYINAGNGLRAHVVANGTNSLAFINEFGDVVLGTVTGPATAIAAAWNNDVATFSPGKINWSDGSVWNLTTAAAPQVTVTDYINLGNHGAAHVVRRPGGSAQIFINEFGNIVLGGPSTTQSTVGAWGNDVATFNGSIINWSDGSVWS